MTNVVRPSARWALLCTLLLVPAAAAQSETLKTAMELFDRQEYVEAQNVALKVDREQLSDAERAELDRLLEVLPEAIQGGKKAEQDQADADAAYEQGRWDQAERLYRAVLANEYAAATLRIRATEQCQRIAEKKQLSEAAKPEGPAAEQPAAKPAQKPAAEPAATQPAAGAQEPAPPPSAEATPPPAGPQRLTIVDQMRQRDNLLWQRAVRKMQELARQARAAMAAERFGEARQLAAQALNRIEAARIYAVPASKYETRKAEALALKQEVADQYDDFLVQLAEKERREIIARQEVRRQLYEQRTREKVEQLFNTAHQLNQEQRFGEAAEAIRQILYLEPANAEARHKLDVYEDLASLWRQKGASRDLYRQEQAALVDAHESLIPWNYEVLYPRNWREIVRKRAGLERGYRPNDEDRELNRKLQETLPDISFEEQPVEQVIEFLADLNQVNLAVDWDDLEVNGIERDRSVTLRLRDVSFQTVLDEVLSQIGGSDVALGFAVGNNLLRIATKEKLDRDKFVRVYDIRDLLVSPARFTNAQRLDPTQALGQATQSSAGTGAGSSTGLFSQIGDPSADILAQGPDAALVVDDIMDIIRQNVEPDSWRETGGGDGALRELNGQLVVYNTSDAQEQVTNLLSQLRQTRALQIAFELRFLSVTDNFLEEMGVDLDFVFNAGSASFDQAFQGNAPIVDPFTGAAVLIPREFSRLGAFAGVPAFGQPLTPGGVPSQPFGQAALVPPNGGVLPHINDMTPIRMQQGSLPLVNPGNINTGVPGTFGNNPGLQPALNIAGSFLDNLQVDFLIRATQASRRSSIVQAPRLVAFNGSWANIFVGTVRTYVASLQPQLAEGAAAFQPQIATASSGSSIDLRYITISADRKYVTVQVTATQANPPRLERVEIQRASGNSPGAFVTTLEQQSATINTMVSIPDGGTILLGGMKMAGEVEIDAGVPILSKIPILKRAFTNTTTVKDVQTLLILMKAKIIIQEEAEQEAFPSLSRAGG